MTWYDDPAYAPYAPFMEADLFRTLHGAVGALDDSLCRDANACERNANGPGPALRTLVELYGERGLLRFVTRKAFGGATDALSVRAVCFIRERLAQVSPLAEVAFAMQGLGSYPLTHVGGTVAEEVLPQVVSGAHVAAFALTEPSAGSDLGGIRTTATQVADGYRLQGEKVFISNAGVADGYTVFALTHPDASKASRRLSAFYVPTKTAGVTTTPMKVLGGHPIGCVHFDDVVVPASHLLGDPGRGLSLALATLGRFRTTVGAAAVGFAQRALDEAIAHVRTRQQFGAPLAELPQVQGRLGDMACLLEASRLLVYRSAHALDVGAPREETSRMGSMAKLVATENAQQVIDSAVQLLGGKGVLADSPVARLYEEVRALRIYEGTSDVQRTLIARAVLSPNRAGLNGQREKGDG